MHFVRPMPCARLPANALLRSLLVVLTAASSLPVMAEPPLRRPTCLTYDARYEEAPLMRVNAGDPEGRVHLFKEARACPETGPCAWKQRAYLVPGDVVFAGPEIDGFRCVYFGAATSAIISGFLPASALDPAPDGGALDPGFLSGTWTHSQGNPITMKRDDDGAVHASGEALWTGLHGAVHDGSLNATAHPVGDLIVFREGRTTGHGEADLAGEGNDANCVVWMRRRGPYLVVHDNMQCGGVNVRFQGIYVRQVKPAGSRSRGSR